MEAPNKIIIFQHGENVFGNQWHQKESEFSTTINHEYIRKDALLEWARECKAKIDKNFFNNPNDELATKRLMFDVFIDKINSL